jgi:transcriptional regulator with XRE-family HTH domain
MHGIVTDSYRKSITQSNIWALYAFGMNDIEFASRFKDACREANVELKQKTIARAFGVSTATAWNYLNGTKLPAMDNAVGIAMKLGVCVEWLLTGRGPRRPHETRRAAEDMVDISDLSPKAKAAVKNTVNAFKDAPDPKLTGS